MEISQRGNGVKRGKRLEGGWFTVVERGFIICIANRYKNFMDRGKGAPLRKAEALSKPWYISVQPRGCFTLWRKNTRKLLWYIYILSVLPRFPALKTPQFPFQPFDTSSSRISPCFLVNWLLVKNEMSGANPWEEQRFYPVSPISKPSFPRIGLPEPPDAKSSPVLWCWPPRQFWLWQRHRGRASA